MSIIPATHPEELTAATQAPPAFMEADPGSLLDWLDNTNADLEAALEATAASRRTTVEARAVAILRDEVAPLPVEDAPIEGEPVNVEPRHVDLDDLDLGTIAGIRAAKRAGLLPERFSQSHEAFNREVAASRGQHHRSHLGTPRIAHLPRVRRGASRAGRPGFRRTVAPSRAGPGDDDGGSEPPGRSTASGAAVWRLSALDSLTPARFHEEADRFLVGVASDRVGATKARIFVSLSAGLQRAFWSTLRAELDGELMRVGNDTWAPRRGTALAAELEQSEAKGGAA
jgi:hypothetical protein